MTEYKGEERRKHLCIQEETIGKFKEFIESMKGMKFILSTIILTIIIQVTTFAYLYGGLTTTVTKNTEHLWKEVDPIVLQNTKNIDKILMTFELMKK